MKIRWTLSLSIQSYTNSELASMCLSLPLTLSKKLITAWFQGGNASFVILPTSVFLSQLENIDVDIARTKIALWNTVAQTLQRLHITINNLPTIILTVLNIIMWKRSNTKRHSNRAPKWSQGNLTVAYSTVQFLHL